MEKISDEKYILLEDQSKLHWLPKRYDLYFNKTTLIFGAPQTGKTTILDEILYLCRNKAPVIFAIAPTNASNNTYTGKIPKSCILSELKIPWIENFVRRQRYLAEVYQNSNNLATLKSLFCRVATDSDIRLVKTTVKRATDAVSFIEKQDWPFSKKRSQRIEITQVRDNFLRKYFKNVIRSKKHILMARIDLSILERGALDYLDINPNAVLILDDCASNFKKWYKQTTAFKEMFYNVRWLNLTLIITTQDDKEIDSELRKSSMIQIFTSSQIASANFERGSNFYSKDIRLRSQRCIKACFDQPKGELPHFRKLVYIRGDSEPFRYTIAELYEDFKFGCSELWKFDKKISDNFNSARELNPYYTKGSAL